MPPQDNQSPDVKNIVLAVVLSTMVLLGWTVVADRFFPTEAPTPVVSTAAPAGDPAVPVNVVRCETRAKTRHRHKTIQGPTV